MRFRARMCGLLFASMLLSGCTVWRERPVVNNWRDTTGGESLERSFWKEVQTKNWKELDHHIAGNYISITPTGRLDRAAAFERIQQLQLEDYSLGDFQIELNSSTLVVTYILTARGTMAGQPIPSQPIRMMTIWQQQKAGWLAIAHSSTELEK